MMINKLLSDCRSNGEMEDALVEAQKAQYEYYDFINNIATEHMAKDGRGKERLQSYY